MAEMAQADGSWALGGESRGIIAVVLPYRYCFWNLSSSRSHFSSLLLWHIRLKRSMDRWRSLHEKYMAASELTFAGTVRRALRSDRRHGVLSCAHRQTMSRMNYRVVERARWRLSQNNLLLPCLKGADPWAASWSAVKKESLDVRLVKAAVVESVAIVIVWSANNMSNEVSGCWRGSLTTVEDHFVGSFYQIGGRSVGPRLICGGIEDAWSSTGEGGGCWIGGERCWPTAVLDPGQCESFIEIKIGETAGTWMSWFQLLGNSGRLTEILDFSFCQVPESGQRPDRLANQVCSPKIMLIFFELFLLCDWPFAVPYPKVKSVIH